MSSGKVALAICGCEFKRFSFPFLLTFLFYFPLTRNIIIEESLSFFISFVISLLVSLILFGLTFLCNDLIRRANRRKKILRPLSPHLPRIRYCCFSFRKSLFVFRFYLSNIQLDGFILYLTFEVFHRHGRPRHLVFIDQDGLHWGASLGHWIGSKSHSFRSI